MRWQLHMYVLKDVSTNVFAHSRSDTSERFHQYVCPSAVYAIESHGDAAPPRARASSYRRPMAASTSINRFARSIFLLIFVVSSNAHGVFGCYGGSLTVSSSYTCCASTPSAGWDYRITTSSDDHYTARVYESSSSSYYYTSTTCQVRSSGNSCTGSACVFSTRNTCDADTRGALSTITPSYLCLKITCDNWFSSCSFSSVSAAFYTRSRTPTPTPTPTPYPPSWIPSSWTPTQAPTPPMTVRVPKPSYSYTTTKKSTKGLRAGLGIGLSLGGGLLMWCLRGCRGKNIDATDPGAPETSTTQATTNMPPLQRESPIV